jgi:cyclase
MRFEPSDILPDGRVVSPSAERNKGPIAELLMRILPEQGDVLEISSGTGQHVLHFAQAMPHIRWQPTEPDAENLKSIAAWLASAPLPNVNAPIHLDVQDEIWPVGKVAAVICLNMIHIAPPSATEALLRGASRVMSSGGILFLYGPYRRQGRHVSAGNKPSTRCSRPGTRNGASATLRTWRLSRPPKALSCERSTTCPRTTSPSSSTSGEARRRRHEPFCAAAYLLDSHRSPSGLAHGATGHICVSHLTSLRRCPMSRTSTTPMRYEWPMRLGERKARHKPALFAALLLSGILLLGTRSAPTQETPAAETADFSAVEVKATKVAGNVYELTSSGGKIGATAGNIGVSVGEDGILMVDDQFAPLAPKIRAALHQLSPKPVRFVINTHWHEDHAGANAEFAETATILAHANVRKRLIAGSRTPLPAFWRGPGVFSAFPPVARKALPVITFEQGISLWLNGEEIRVIHPGIGHTDGDSVIWFTKSNVVHMGDDYFAGAFPFVDSANGGSVRDLIQSLDVILGQIPADAKIIPGHGPVTGVDELRKYRDMLAASVAAVTKGRGAGKTVEQMQREKILAPWADWGKGFITQDLFTAVIAQDLAKN